MSVGITTSTLINAVSRGTVAATAHLVHLASVIATLRGLDQTYLQERLAVIEAGLRTWLMGRWLEKMRIEIWDPKTDAAVEVYVFHVGYEPFGRNSSESYEVKADELRGELAKLKKLRPGMQYRLIVETKDGRPDVPGWSPTKPRGTGGLSKRSMGGVIKTPGTKVELEFYMEDDSSGV